MLSYHTEAKDHELRSPPVRLLPRFQPSGVHPSVSARPAFQPSGVHPSVSARPAFHAYAPAPAFPGPLIPSPRIHNFGTMLEPRWIVGTEPLDQ